MALSSFSFLLPLPHPDAVHSSATPCSRPCSISTSSPSSLWISKLQFAVRAGKGKRDFFLDDDGDSGEDKIPEHIVDMEEWMRNRPEGFGVGKVRTIYEELRICKKRVRVWNCNVRAFVICRCMTLRWRKSC